MSQQPKNHEEAQQGGDKEAREHEPYGPGQYRSGTDGPGEPTKKNPGHTNPAHNTSGQEREDRASPVQDPPEQAQPPSYPGLVGEKARELKENKESPAAGSVDRHPDTSLPRKRDS